jgi:hypothetical protein
LKQRRQAALSGLQFFDARDVDDRATDELSGDSLLIPFQADFDGIASNKDHVVIDNVLARTVGGMNGKRFKVFRCQSFPDFSGVKHAKQPDLFEFEFQARICGPSARTGSPKNLLKK